MFPGYRDVEQVGEGGLGVVYRAVRESTGGMVAIKELRNVATGSPAWHRAHRELEALLRLKGHPYVVSVEEIVQGPAGPALVMEYLAGGSLDERAEHGPLPIDEVLYVTHCVAQALGDAHAAGIVHRDVKPHNVLVGSFGQVKVCDFGISSLIRQEGGRTQTRSLTLAYASPEELEGDTVAGPPADVYSLSATLLHLLTGRAPTLRERFTESWSIPYEDDPVYAPFIARVRQGLATAPADRPTMAALVRAANEASTRAQRALLTRLPDVASRGDSTIAIVPSPPLPDSTSQPAAQPPPLFPPVRRRRLSPAWTGVAAIVAILVIGVTLATYEARQVYTVAFDDAGAVAVYRGGDVLWFRESVERVSGLDRSSLDDDSVELVEGRPTFESQAEADRFIAERLREVAPVEPEPSTTTTQPSTTAPSTSVPSTTVLAPIEATASDREVCTAALTLQRNIATGFGSDIASGSANYRTVYVAEADGLSAPLVNGAATIAKLADEVQASPETAATTQTVLTDFIATCTGFGALG